MSERCACGCPNLVTEASPTIFFASAPCQTIWVASLKLPEDERSQWRWRQRFVTLLVYQVEWPYFWDYEFPAEALINLANEFIRMMYQGWEVADEEDAMRVLMLKYMRDSPMSRRNGFGRDEVHTLLARWRAQIKAQAPR